MTEPRHLLNPKRPETNGCVEPLLGIITQKSGLGPSSVSLMDSALGAASMARWMHCVGIRRKKVNLILDADVRGFFDTLSHEWMVKVIEHRIAEGYCA